MVFTPKAWFELRQELAEAQKMRDEAEAYVKELQQRLSQLAESAQSPNALN